MYLNSTDNKTAEIKSYFNSENYINELIKSRKWSSHGAELFQHSEFLEEFEDLFPNADKDDAVLKSLLQYWIPIRLNYVIYQINDELSKSENLYRSMLVNDAQLNSITSRVADKCIVQDLGLYWSTSRNIYAYGATEEQSKEKNNDILMETSFNGDHINWIETIRSRIDYFNGDDEQEMQLKPESLISAKIIKINID